MAQILSKCALLTNTYHIKPGEIDGMAIIWLEELRGFNAREITLAFENYRAEGGKTFPTAADILQILKGEKNKKKEMNKALYIELCTRKREWNKAISADEPAEHLRITLEQEAYIKRYEEQEMRAVLGEPEKPLLQIENHQQKRFAELMARVNNRWTFEEATFLEAFCSEKKFVLLDAQKAAIDRIKYAHEQSKLSDAEKEASKQRSLDMLARATELLKN